MTIKQLRSLSFTDAVNQLLDEHPDVTTYDALKKYAKEMIDNDNLLVAMHILDALKDDYADYYGYDYSMGTLETPTPLFDIDDLEDYCDVDDDSGFIANLPKEFNFKSNINTLVSMYHATETEKDYVVTADSDCLWHFSKSEIHQCLLNGDYVIVEEET